jgi:hypothetical protein
MLAETIPLALPLAFLAVCALAGEVLLDQRRASWQSAGLRPKAAEQLRPVEVAKG